VYCAARRTQINVNVLHNVRLAHVDGLTGGTMVRLRSEAIERFRVDYVAGFSTAGFSYFLTNQRDKFELTNAGLLPSVSGDLVSRLIQVSWLLICDCCRFGQMYVRVYVCPKIYIRRALCKKVTVAPRSQTNRTSSVPV